MPKPVNECCECCKFFQPKSDDKQVGWCTRYAPYPDVYLGNKNPEHPEVRPDGWCGDYVKP